MDKHIVARLPRILSEIYENLATYTFTAGKRELQDVSVQR